MAGRIVISVAALLPAAFAVPGPVAPSTFTVRAWDSPAGQTAFPFPDQDPTEFPEIYSKPNTGIALSGGGSRAYLSSLGVLGGLHELGLIEKLRYTTAISGGSWAAGVYFYHNLTDVTDSTLLGEIAYPKDLTLANLATADSKSARTFTDIFPPTTLTINPALGPLFQQWEEQIDSIYFGRVNIAPGAPFSYTAETVNRIKSKNPTLASTDFLTVKEPQRSAAQRGSCVYDVDPRPFPILGVTLIGPASLEPYTPFNRNFTFIEMTALAAGVPYRNVFDYDGQPFQVGGQVETFAFTLPVTSASGLPHNSPHGYVYIGNTSDAELVSLTLASGSSSYTFGGLLAANPNTTFPFFQDEINYWTPSDSKSHSSISTVIADGGVLGDLNIQSLLQRGVKKIVACSFTGYPLNGAWVPVLDAAGNAINFSQTDFDLDIAALFGQVAIEYIEVLTGQTNNPALISEVVGQDFTRNQVFPKEDFATVANLLLAAKAKGTGTVAKSHHTTVQNDVYNIPAGFEVDILWFYLDIATVWESQLAPEVADLLVDPVYGRFPNWPTLLANFNTTQANLLADFNGWVIKENAELFSEFLNY